MFAPPGVDTDDSSGEELTPPPSPKPVKARPSFSFKSLFTPTKRLLKSATDASFLKDDRGGNIQSLTPVQVASFRPPTPPKGKKRVRISLDGEEEGEDTQPGLTPASAPAIGSPSSTSLPYLVDSGGGGELTREKSQAADEVLILLRQLVADQAVARKENPTSKITEINPFPTPQEDLPDITPANVKSSKHSGDKGKAQKSNKLETDKAKQPTVRQSEAKAAKQHSDNKDPTVHQQSKVHVVKPTEVPVPQAEHHLSDSYYQSFSPEVESGSGPVPPLKQLQDQRIPASGEHEQGDTEVPVHRAAAAPLADPAGETRPPEPYKNRMTAHLPQPRPHATQESQGPPHTYRPNYAYHGQDYYNSYVPYHPDGGISGDQVPQSNRQQLSLGSLSATTTSTQQASLPPYRGAGYTPSPYQPHNSQYPYYPAPAQGYQGYLPLPPHPPPFYPHPITLIPYNPYYSPLSAPLPAPHPGFYSSSYSPDSNFHSNSSPNSNPDSNSNSSRNFNAYIPQPSQSTRSAPIYPTDQPWSPLTNPWSGSSRSSQETSPSASEAITPDGPILQPGPGVPTVERHDTQIAMGSVKGSIGSRLSATPGSARGETEHTDRVQAAIEGIPAANPIGEAEQTEKQAILEAQERKVWEYYRSSGLTNGALEEAVYKALARSPTPASADEQLPPGKPTFPTGGRRAAHETEPRRTESGNFRARDSSVADKTAGLGLVTGESTQRRNDKDRRTIGDVLTTSPSMEVVEPSAKGEHVDKWRDYYVAKGLAGNKLDKAVARAMAKEVKSGSGKATVLPVEVPGGHAASEAMYQPLQEKEVTDEKGLADLSQGMPKSDGALPQNLESNDEATMRLGDKEQVAGIDLPQAAFSSPERRRDHPDDIVKGRFEDTTEQLDKLKQYYESKGLSGKELDKVVAKAMAKNRGLSDQPPSGRSMQLPGEGDTLHAAQSIPDLKEAADSEKERARKYYASKGLSGEELDQAVAKAMAKSQKLQRSSNQAPSTDGVTRDDVPPAGQPPGEPRRSEESKMEAQVGRAGEETLREPHASEDLTGRDLDKAVTKSSSNRPRSKPPVDSGEQEKIQRAEEEKLRKYYSAKGLAGDDLAKAVAKSLRKQPLPDTRQQPGDRTESATKDPPLQPPSLDDKDADASELQREKLMQHYASKALSRAQLRTAVGRALGKSAPGRVPGNIEDSTRKEIKPNSELIAIEIQREKLTQYYASKGLSGADLSKAVGNALAKSTSPGMPDGSASTLRDDKIRADEGSSSKSSKVKEGNRSADPRQQTTSTDEVDETRQESVRTAKSGEGSFPLGSPDRGDVLGAEGVKRDSGSKHSAKAIGNRDARADTSRPSEARADEEHSTISGPSKADETRLRARLASKGYTAEQIDKMLKKSRAQASSSAQDSRATEPSASFEREPSHHISKQEEDKMRKYYAAKGASPEDIEQMIQRARAKREHEGQPKSRISSEEMEQPANGLNASQETKMRAALSARGASPEDIDKAIHRARAKAGQEEQTKRSSRNVRKPETSPQSWDPALEARMRAALSAKGASDDQIEAMVAKKRKAALQETLQKQEREGMGREGQRYDEKDVQVTANVRRDKGMPRDSRTEKSRELENRRTDTGRSGREGHEPQVEIVDEEIMRQVEKDMREEARAKVERPERQEEHRMRSKREGASEVPVNGETREPAKRSSKDERSASPYLSAEGVQPDADLMGVAREIPEQVFPQHREDRSSSAARIAQKTEQYIVAHPHGHSPSSEPETQRPNETNGSSAQPSAGPNTRAPGSGLAESSNSMQASKGQVAGYSVEPTTDMEVTWSKTLLSLANCIDLGNQLLSSLRSHPSSGAIGQEGPPNPLQSILPKLVAGLLIQRDMLETMRSIFGDDHAAALGEFAKHLAVVKRYLTTQVERMSSPTGNAKDRDLAGVVGGLKDGMARSFLELALRAVLSHFLGSGDSATSRMAGVLFDLFKEWREGGISGHHLGRSISALRTEVEGPQHQASVHVHASGEEDKARTRGHGLLALLEKSFDLISPEHSTSNEDAKQIGPSSPSAQQMEAGMLKSGNPLATFSQKIADTSVPQSSKDGTRQRHSAEGKSHGLLYKIEDGLTPPPPSVYEAESTPVDQAQLTVAGSPEPIMPLFSQRRTSKHTTDAAEPQPAGNHTSSQPRHTRPAPRPPKAPVQGHAEPSAKVHLRAKTEEFFSTTPALPGTSRMVTHTQPHLHMPEHEHEHEHASESIITFPPGPAMGSIPPLEGVHIERHRPSWSSDSHYSDEESEGTVDSDEEARKLLAHANSGPRMAAPVHKVKREEQIREKTRPSKEMVEEAKEILHGREKKERVVSRSKA